MVELLPARTRMPPERRLNWAPSAMVRFALPSIVRELRVALPMTVAPVYGTP